MAIQKGNRVGIARLDPRILPNPHERAPKLEDEFTDNFDMQTAKELHDYEQGQRHVRSSSLAKEQAQRLHELNVESRKAHRFPHQEDFKMDRTGKIMHMNEFMRRLKSVLPPDVKAWYTEKGGMARTLGLFVSHPGIIDPTTCNHKRGEVHYVCYVQVPLMQEYEELYFDLYDVPLGSKRRGWRTVILNLIEDRILTEEQAHKAFGEPATGKVSLRYREYLQYLRSRKIGVV